MKSIFLPLLFLMFSITSSQSLKLFDVNASNFPTIRGKFYSFDAQGRQLRPSVSDLTITENGVARTISSVSCPPPIPPKALSSVLVIDISGSMDWGINDKNINLAKSAANAWVNALSIGASECAITSFDHSNYLNQDFTVNRQKLLTAISQLQPQGGTDYGAALINPMSGGLVVSAKGKHKRVIVLLTDGLALEPNKQQIIQEANRQNCSIYCVTLGMSAPQSLLEIASQTGGEVFENVTTTKEAEDVYNRILQEVQGGEPCTIEWQSSASCSSSSTSVELRSVSLNITAQATFMVPNSALARLDFTQLPLRFDNPPIGVPTVQTLTITASNSSFTVSNIFSSNPQFTVSPTSFTLQPNQSQDIDVTFTAVDSGYTFTKLTIQNNICEQSIFISGGYKGKKPKIQTLKLTFPNGGETFVVGSDSTIRWEGIPATDVVKLEYSTNNGSSWNLLDTASGLSYSWGNIPRPSSTQCLVRVKQLGSNSSSSTDSVRILSAGSEAVHTISYSPDGNMLAAAKLGNIIIFNPITGQELRKVSNPGHTDDINTIAFSPDGSILASGSYDKTMKLWNTTTGQEIYTLNGHTGAVNSVAFSPLGGIVASGGGTADGTIKLWEVNTGQLLRTLTTNQSAIKIKFSPDGTILASGGWDKNIKLWDVKTGQELRTLTGQNSPVQSVAFSPDGAILASAGNNSLIKLWDVKTGQEILSINQGSVNYTSSIAFSPDGNAIAAGVFLEIYLWDPITGQKLRTIQTVTDNNSIAFSPDGGTLASGDRDWNVRLYNIEGIPLQSDQSDRVFSIVDPLPASQNIIVGEVIRGTSKDSVIVDFVRNTGSWRFSVDSIYFRGADAGSFSLIAGIPRYSVEGNRSHSGEFRFSPTRVGAHLAEIVIITQSDTLIQTISGIGVEKTIEVIGQMIDFGTVKVGSTKDTLQSITIRNNGSVPITVLGTTHRFPNSTDFTTISGGGSFTLAPNETHLMDLRFTAREVGRTSGTLEFTYNGIGSPAIIQLFGEGKVTAPIIKATTTTFADLLCDTVVSTTIPITNGGGANLVIDTINIVGVNSAEFTMPRMTPISIEPDSTLQIPIMFRPQSAGAKAAIVEFHSNADPDSILLVPITARKDNIGFQTNNIDLGIVCPNESSNISMVINNIGTIESKASLNADTGVRLALDSILVPSGSNVNVDLEVAGISQEGAFSRAIRIKDRCGNETVAIVSGIVETPRIQTNDVTVTTLLGSSIQEKIIVRNISVRPITITGLNGVMAPFMVIGTPFPVTIAPQGTAEITISYTPLDTNQVSQTFEIMGSPCSISQNVKITGGALKARLGVQISNIYAYPGDEIEIPIMVTDAQNLVRAGISAIDVILSFNPSILYPKGYSVTSVNDTLSTITVTNLSVNNPSGISEILIPFVVMLGNADSCTLGIEQVIPQGGTASINTFNGVFTLLGICREGGTRFVLGNSLPYLLKVMPNPSDGNVEVDVTVIEKGISTMRIFSSNGSLIEEHRFTTIGNKKVAIDSRAYNDGLYFITLQTPTTFDTAKLLIVK